MNGEDDCRPQCRPWTFCFHLSLLVQDSVLDQLEFTEWQTIKAEVIVVFSLSACLLSWVSHLEIPFLDDFHGESVLHPYLGHHNLAWCQLVTDSTCGEVTSRVFGSNLRGQPCFLAREARGLIHCNLSAVVPQRDDRMTSDKVHIPAGAHTLSDR